MDDPTLPDAPPPPARRGTVAVGAGVAAGVFLAGAALLALQWRAEPPTRAPDAPFADLVRLAQAWGALLLGAGAIATTLFGALAGAMAAQSRGPKAGLLAGVAVFLLASIGLFLVAALPAALVDGGAGAQRLMLEVLVVGAMLGVPTAIGGAVAGWWARDVAPRA